MRRYNIYENAQDEGWDDWKGEITDWDRYPDDSDWSNDGAEDVGQETNSSKTSRYQLPASVIKMAKHGDWAKGNTNFDMGGGISDNIQYWLNGETDKIRGLKKGQENETNYEVTNLVFDPFNRDNDYNEKTLNAVEEMGGAHTVTCNNVLNVIDSKQEILNVIQRCAEVLRPDGVAYFITYEKGGKGIGQKTSDGFQQCKKTQKYLPLIHQFFNRVKYNDGTIIAKDPIKQDTPANWFTNVEDSLGQTNPRLLKLKKINENKINRIIRESINKVLNNII